LLDGFTERWLFDSALLRGAREAQFVTNCKEVADVLRFHDQHSKIFGVEMTPRKCKVETVYQIEILDANRPEMKEPTTEGGSRSPLCRGRIDQRHILKVLDRELVYDRRGAKILQRHHACGKDG
jgi:hypothetical protein